MKSRGFSVKLVLHWIITNRRDWKKHSRAASINWAAQKRNEALNTSGLKALERPQPTRAGEATRSMWRQRTRGAVNAGAGERDLALSSLGADGR